MAATPAEFVKVDPVDGVRFVNVTEPTAGTEKVTKVFGTGAPVLSVTVALATKGQELETVLAAQLFAAKDNFRVGVPLVPAVVDEYATCEEEIEVVPTTVAVAIM